MINKKETSDKVAREAAKILQDPNASDENKSVAASALAQARGKVKFVAVKGINFDALKSKPRVEPGEPIPEDINTKVIADLLVNGDIKEA